MNKKLEELKLKYRRTFNTEDGEQVLDDLKRRFGFEATTFSGDPYQTAFNEGQRAALLLIVRMLSEKRNQQMSEEAIQDTGSQEAVAAPNFLESIPEELRSEPSLRNFQDAGSLAKSYVHAQRMIGADKVSIPSKSATPDEWRQVYQKLGAPDAADAYQLDGMDDTAAGQLRQQAFEAGLSQNQAKAVADFYMGQQNSRNEALKKLVKTLSMILSKSCAKNTAKLLTKRSRPLRMQQSSCSAA